MQSQQAGWLLENGPRELEKLFRSVVFRPRVPILVTDDERLSTEASFGASRLLGLPRREIIGRKIDDLADPSFKAQVPGLWSDFLGMGAQQGTLRLTGPDGKPRDVEYVAKSNILPVRHLLLLREQPAAAQKPRAGSPATVQTEAWNQDYALFLLDANGCIAGWYAGANRTYGYTQHEVAGQHVSLLYPGEDGAATSRRELDRAVASGHFGNECFHIRKDQSQFWANFLIMALRSESDELQGFAAVVRDFTDRDEAARKASRARGYRRTLLSEQAIAGIVSGEFDQIQDGNDVFLKLVGYEREDLQHGLLHWPDLTPPEFSAADDLAHEEELRFGACTPYEKEFVRKDGVRVPVLIATAVVKLAPFRWITFVQDLRERPPSEDTGEGEAALTQDFDEMVGVSTAIRRMQRQVEMVAPTDATVLILGETGTGKELVARAIHRMGPRHKFPFISLNCAAIPTGLLESELFGYERGAFTGALLQKIGRFEMAQHGTLFLDEVGDIPLDLQPKLLRALQEKSFERLGGARTIPINVRLVAATNRNLAEMMGDKLFRSDLYYRLNVFPIKTPPLRDHAEDIPALVWHFTKKYAGKMGRHIDRIPPETMRTLVSWHWPGNVRELENFIERSVILTPGASLRSPLDEIRKSSLLGSPIGTLEQVEREHLLRALRESRGVVTLAATRLGLHRTTLNAMMRKLGISRRDII